jgi:hypothetical protein
MAENNYGNIGKESFDEINQGAQLFKETIEATGKVLGSSFKNSVSLATQLSGISGDILKDRNELKSLEKAQTDTARELNQLRAEENNLQSQLLGASKEEKETLFDKLQAIQVRKDAMSSMVEDAKVLVTEAKKLASQTKFFDRLQLAAETIPGLGPLISGPFQAAAAAAKEAAESGGGLMNTYVAGGKELLKVLGPTAVLGVLLKASAETKELSTNLGISLDSAIDMQKRFGQIASDSKDVRINSTALAKAQNTLQKELKLGVEFSGETLQNFTKLTEYMGVSAAAASRLALLTEGTAMSSSEFQNSLAQSVVESNKALGVNVSLSEAFETIGSASASTYLTLRRSPQQLGKMVAEAKKLGLEFSQIESIASSMLDFESSIQAELEAEVLTGKQLNFERARMAALQGDTLTLTREIATQVGTIAEFENMNVIARESLAKSMGMNSDQMAEMLLKSEALAANETIAAEMSAEQLQSARERAKVTGDLGAALLEINQEADVSAKFEQSAVKLQDAFKQVAIQVMPVVTKLADLVAKIFSSPLLKTAAIIGSVASAGMLLASLGRGTMIRPMITRDASAASGGSMFGGGGSAKASGNMFSKGRRFKATTGGMALGAGIGIAGSMVGAQLQKSGQEAIGKGISMGAQGAMMGAMFGPMGMAIGGGVGLLAGTITGHLEKQEKAREEAEQKRADEYQKTMQELAQKEAKIFLDSNQVGMGLTLGTNYKTQ